MAALLSRRSPGWAIAMLRRASNRIPSIDLLLTVLLSPVLGLPSRANRKIRLLVLKSILLLALFSTTFSIG